MLLKPRYEKVRAAMKSKHGLEKGEEVFWGWAKKKGINPELKSYVFYSQPFSLKALKDDIVEGWFATGDPDIYKDILTDVCLDDLQVQLKTLPITIDLDHESFKGMPSEIEKHKSLNPIAKVIDSKKVGNKIFTKTKLNSHHQRYAEVKGSIDDGFLHSFSFSYIPLEFEYKSIDGVRHRLLNKVRLINGTYTGVPVNPEASFTNVMLKSLQESFPVDFKEADNFANDILNGTGGKSMTDEENKPKEKTDPKAGENPAQQDTNTDAKPEPKPEPKPEENSDAKPEPKPAEKPAEKPAADAEVKSLMEKIHSEIAELKSSFKPTPDGAEMKSFGERLESIEGKLKNFDVVMSKPQFKAQMEAMEGVLEKERKATLEAEQKKNGPLSSIR